MARKVTNEVGLRLTAKDDASPSVRAVSGQVFALAGAFGIATSATDLLIRSWRNLVEFNRQQLSAMISTNAQFERFAVSLEVLYKNADIAREKLDWIKEFAKLTPYELPEVVQATIQLKAYGLTAEEWLPRIGNLASAMGVPMEQAIDATGKLASGLSGLAVRQFAYMGIARETWAEQGIQFSKTGEAMADTGKMMQALANIIEGRFGGMMERQSQTYEGMLTNLEDWVNLTRMDIGKTIFEQTKDQLQVLMDTLEAFQASGKIDDFTEAVTGMFPSKEQVQMFLEVANILLGFGGLLPPGFTLEFENWLRRIQEEADAMRQYEAWQGGRAGFDLGEPRTEAGRVSGRSVYARAPIGGGRSGGRAPIPGYDSPMEANASGFRDIRTETEKWIDSLSEAERQMILLDARTREYTEFFAEGAANAVGDATARMIVYSENFGDAWMDAIKAVEAAMVQMAATWAAKQLLQAVLGAPVAGQHGIPSVPRTGAYLLHEGEQVIPAAAAPAERGGTMELHIHGDIIGDRRYVRTKVLPLIREAQERGWN